MPSAKVYTSNMLSCPFLILNGTRQGCPLSLSILIEHLAGAIRAAPQVTGFKFQNSSHVINLFADDIIIFLTNAETSLATVHDILTTFSKLSYYKVNYTKSLVLDLGIDPVLQKKSKLPTHIHGVPMEFLI